MICRFQDTRVNRLEDTFILWRSAVSNKLLAHVNIILFLNKCDLLRVRVFSAVLTLDYLVLREN